MRIWLATVGEPLPIDGDNVRLLRTAQFAEWLAKRGDEVVFFTGTMDHTGRRLRAEETTHVDVTENYKIVMLKGRLYKRSRSIARFMNHRDVAASFALEAPNLPAPDVILASFPTSELCRAVADYAEPRGIPYVIDARDFWPDLFIELLPRPLQFMAPFLFRRQEREATDVFSRATAVSGMTNSAMEWALRKAGRAKSEKDFWHPFTYPGSGEAVDETAVDLSSLGLDKIPQHHTTFCFFGTHSHRVNLEMFVQAFRIVEKRKLPVSVIFCGDGEVHENLRQLAASSSNIHFPGWMNAVQIEAVLSISDVGILPYNTPDFFMNMPNKMAEYFYGGLPVLSCTDGEVRKLIEDRKCGFWCEPNIAAIADEVEAVVNNPDNLADAKIHARQVFLDYFDQDTVFAEVRDRLSQMSREAQLNRKSSI
jgi:glycosyltransferase involved in cell wall biosynthesis